MKLGISWLRMPNMGRTQSTKGLTSNAAPHATGNGAYTLPRPTTPPSAPDTTYARGAGGPMDLSTILDTDFWSDKERATREGDKADEEWRSDAIAALDYAGDAPAVRAGWGVSSTAQAYARGNAAVRGTTTVLGAGGVGLAGAVAKQQQQEQVWDNPFTDVYQSSSSMATPTRGRTDDVGDERVGRQRSRSRKGDDPKDMTGKGRRKSVDAGGSRARSKSPGAVGRKESKRDKGTPERRKSKSGGGEGMAGMISTDDGGSSPALGARGGSKKKRAASTDRKHKRSGSTAGDGTLDRTKSGSGKRSKSPGRVQESWEVADGYY
ncbi:hypothetical protein M427DRAFT_61293 [Gonapodya prolifera JEL478]|uniref:Uncharacterized protein n=1 Tax=Gonapodya prolifera (strain JEL478) TaxID=1344416 RepID=A0A139A2Q1_GONPJ|nr:hypothetical protein M427DRAFT_61293 [Gonapodya prolifera JEL478]|eukprot:KXS10928.1 hypothetical protein M427DRAFT_61293 [Gonapodya prolifera JEL478]